MKIFDFGRLRRPYMLSLYSKEGAYQYNFFPYHNRHSVSWSQEAIQQLKDFNLNIVNIDNLKQELMSSDVLLIDQFIHYKECHQDYFDIINRFKGLVISMDFAWDSYKIPIAIKNKEFKLKYDAIAIAVDYSSSDINKKFIFSQPELDVPVHNNKFVMSSDKMIEKYNLDKYDGIFTITPGRNFVESGILLTCLDIIKQFCKKPFVFCKFKHKDTDESIKYARKVMRRNDIYGNVSSESHKDLGNQFLNYARLSNAHINLDSQSFSNLEAIRCGIPTFEIYKKEIFIPKYYKSALSVFWDKQSISKIYDNPNLSVFQTAKVIVDDMYCTKNLINNIKKYY